MERERVADTLHIAITREAKLKLPNGDKGLHRTDDTVTGYNMELM